MHKLSHASANLYQRKWECWWWQRTGISKHQRPGWTKMLAVDVLFKKKGCDMHCTGLSISCCCSTLRAPLVQQDTS